MVDYSAVRRLSKANAESCRDMTQELKRLAVLAGIGHEEIDRRMMRPNLAIWVETNSDAMTVDDLRDMFDEIAQYHTERRRYHDRDGFYAREAYGPECLALGHVEPEVPEGEDYYDAYSDDELYLDGTHDTGWDGDILCLDTRYGWACTYCESEDCDHWDTGAILWDMLSKRKTE